jgi:hypothetical protein
VLDEQLALIERRLDQIATRTYQRQAGGLLTHARFVADVLRPDPFQARLAALAASRPDPTLVAAAQDPVGPAPTQPAQAADAATTIEPAAGGIHEHA